MRDRKIKRKRNGGEGFFLVQGTRSRTRTYKTYVENCWDVISHGSQQRRYNIQIYMYMHPRVCILSVYIRVLRERCTRGNACILCNARRQLKISGGPRELGALRTFSIPR